MKGDNIAERLLDFAATVIRFSIRLPKQPWTRHIASQLVRSATSGGANYDEARRAESRKDFAHKTQVAAKEMGESIYWLRLVQRTGLIEGNIQGLVGEATELTSILAASAKTAKARSRPE